MALSIKITSAPPTPPEPAPQRDELVEKFTEWTAVSANLAAVESTYEQFLDHFKKHDPDFAKLADSLPKLQAQAEALKEEVVSLARQGKRTFSDGSHIVRFTDPQKVVIDYEQLARLQPELLDFPGLVKTVHEVDAELFTSLAGTGKISTEVVAAVRKEVPLTKAGKVEFKALPQKQKESL